MITYRDVIDKWPTLAEFAQDAGISHSHARVMKARNSIPREYWNKLADNAKRRSMPDITPVLLGIAATMVRTRARRSDVARIDLKCKASNS